MKLSVKTFLVIIFAPMYVGVIFAVVYPVTLCNEIKEGFELDQEIAMKKYEYSSFNEWRWNSGMALNEDCWWESDWSNARVGLGI